MRGRVRLCPYYFVEAEQSEIARRAGDDRSGRQKISARHARRDFGSIEDTVMSNITKFKGANALALPQKEAMNITKNLGMLLLAIYLILVGITLLLHITIPTIVMGILTLAAGIFDSHWQIETSLLVFAPSL